MKKLALISVANKSQLAQIASRLLRLGYDLASTGGTANALRDAGFDVMDASELTGFPEILRDLVKTLHPKIHGALLPPRTGAADSELATYDIRRIDFLYVGIYELLALIKAGGYSIDDIVEKSDMGGPAMLASGAKGAMLNLLNEKEETPYAGPVVACTPEDCFEAMAWIEQGMPDKQVFVTRMAARAFWLCAQHRAGGAIALSDSEYDAVFGIQVAKLSKGENGPQSPAFHFTTGSDDPLALHNCVQLAGDKPGSNALTDLDRVLTTGAYIATVFGVNVGEAPLFALAVKHGNPCSAATGKTGEEALGRMLWCDNDAIFGGMVLTNFPIDEHLASKLLFHNQTGPRRFLTGLIAPRVSEEAMNVLRPKAESRMLIWGNETIESRLLLDWRGALDREPRRRAVRGGYLKQPNYLWDTILASDGRISPDDPCLTDLLLSIAICATSNSNTITIVKDGMLLGNGVGQQARHRAAWLAVELAKMNGHEHMLEGAAAASDSFFPFPDGMEILANAGIKTIYCTTGSKNDDVVQAAAKELGVRLVQLPDSEGRLFFGH